jgi:2-phospho-L-lactate guanylyltransferase
VKSDTAAGWCALVPQKALRSAKGRLKLPAAQRRAIATAMLRDTVAAVRTVPAVDGVLVLWDDDDDRRVLPGVASVSTRGRGLNESLEYGANVAKALFPGRGLFVLPADLPALTPVELGVCLERASAFSRAYLPDAQSIGTTVLSSTSGVPLVPAYGARSASAHARSGAQRLDSTGLDSLRADVDDLRSLSQAMALGCGYHTLTACAHESLAPEVSQ